MSRRVINVLVISLIFIILFALLYFGLQSVVLLIPQPALQQITVIALRIVFVIIDLIILFVFLLYWWSDVKWTQVQTWAKRKFRR